jgi:hypothetical protein
MALGNPLCKGYDAELDFTPKPNYKCLGRGPPTYSGESVFVRLKALPVDEVKELGKAAGASVNDILVAAIVGTFKRYTSAIGSASCGRVPAFKALMPVALPRPVNPADPSQSLVNRWVFFSTELGDALAAATPAERVAAVVERTGRMQAVRTSFCATQLAITKAVYYLPESTRQDLAGEVFGKHSAVITNVPGPSEELYFAGSLIEEVQMIFTNLIPQVSIISYAGSFFCNMVLDKANFDDAESLPGLWEEEITALTDDLIGEEDEAGAME